MGIHSFDTLEGADPRRTEIVTGRKYPFGNQIKESLLSIPPKVEMKVEETETRRQGEAKLCITLRRISSLSDSPARCFGDLVLLQLYYDFHKKYNNKHWGSKMPHVILFWG